MVTKMATETLMQRGLNGKLDTIRQGAGGHRAIMLLLMGPD